MIARSKNLPPNPLPKYIYKIVTSKIWAGAKELEEVRPMPVDEADGYMHFSTHEQLGKTLSLHFAGQSGLVILSVETSALKKGLKWEPSRGGALFPHLYAPLRLEAVAAHHLVDVAADGTCALPDFSR